MSVRAILRPAADSDVRDIYADLEDRSSGLGGRFFARLRETLELIESMPEAFGVVARGVRGVRVTKFQYVVYYRLLPDRIDVLAVVHGARDSRVWESRL